MEFSKAFQRLVLGFLILTIGFLSLTVQPALVFTSVLTTNAGWMTLFTGIVALTGVCQLVAIAVQSCFMYKGLKATKQSIDISNSINRPFIFINSFESHIINTQLCIMPKWENSGNTPAVNLRNYVNWVVFRDEPPADYGWPDLDKDGNPISGPGDGITTFIGPKATQYADRLNIPLQQMEKVQNRDLRLFVWGWVEYDDILDTAPRHRTEFCNEVIVTHLETDNHGKASIAMQFPQFGALNTAR